MASPPPPTQTLTQVHVKYGSKIFKLGEVVNPYYQKLTREDVREIHIRVSRLESDMENIPTDVTQLQEDLTELNDRLDLTQGAVSQLQIDQGILRTDVDVCTPSTS